MNPIRFHTDTLESFLKEKKIATMAELKAVLNTEIDMTIFRKLQQLGYQTSYSHRGMYYALKTVIRFDHQGLWTFNAARFSIYGTLLATVKAFVNQSEAGHSAHELEDLLFVAVKEPLLQLFRDGHIHREKFPGQYVYFSSDPSTQRKQTLFRREQDFSSVPPGGVEGTRSDLSTQEIKAAIVLFYSVLDEKQRRLYAGLESLKLGHGGDQKMAELLDLDSHTVSKGRQELLRHEFESQRVRRRGAGRKSVEKKLPTSSSASKT